MEVNIIMAQRFILNGTSYHGKGAIKEIATEAISRGFKKAFVCSDPDLIKFGVTKKVLDVLDENGLAYEVYSDIKPNPTVENVKTGVQAFKMHVQIILSQSAVVLQWIQPRLLVLSLTTLNSVML